MSEVGVSPEVAPEPGGWLAEHQRAHCPGGSASSTYQGLLTDEIVLPKSAADATDPLALVLACNAFVETMQDQCYFIAGEFAPEATWSVHAHDYLAQVTAGGHAQYFANHGQDEVALRSVGAALKSMLADPHYELFHLMVRLKRTRPNVARKIASQRGYRDVGSAMRDLDRKFAELEKNEPLTPRHKNWLKSLRKLKVVPDAEIVQNLNRLAAANPLIRPRKAEADAVRAEHERNDPAFRAARSLCEMAGLKFAGMRQAGFAPMRAVWPEGPDRRSFVYRVETDRGPRAAMFYEEGSLLKKRLAVLIEQGGTLPLGSLTLSRGDYNSIVPNAPKA